MITLDDSLFIAKGGERKCYFHPEDDSKLIKIQYDNQIGRNQNTLDLHYYAHLNKKVRNFSKIASLHGAVETNLGPGLVFSVVRDFNGKLSSTFEDVVREKRLTEAQELALMGELQQYLTRHLVVFGDVVLSNVMCQEIAENTYKLIIIDGLGARRFNFKLWLQNRSDLYARLRIKTQYKKFLHKYRLLKAQLQAE